ncbi:MAG: hybrid sensor histidine kinase/response regulator [Desulforhopalus sp.]
MMKKNIKVLIVDDESQNVRIMKELLSYHPQYECKEAKSGEEALDVLKTYFPEIILLDVMMPGINGYEVCKKIRCQHEHKFSKIIMVSGMSMINDRLKGYEAGADDYLTKPYVEEELVAKLEVYSKLNRIEEVDNLKTIALNILSHETKTPLNGILLGSELLREVDGLPEKAKLYVDLIKESGVKIKELVEKISRYYFIKDGIEKNISVNSLCGVLDSVVQLLNDNENQVRVECDCTKDIKFAADWELLKEAFGYVIDISHKNSPVSGVITVNCWINNDDIFIRIADQGSGVEPSLTNRVFDGLFIPDLFHHRKGTGLGLAIAKEVIEEHGGRITCRNSKDSGTIFEISLKDQRQCPDI